MESEKDDHGAWKMIYRNYKDSRTRRAGSSCGGAGSGVGGAGVGGWGRPRPLHLHLNEARLLTQSPALPQLPAESAFVGFRRGQVHCWPRGSRAH